MTNEDDYGDPSSDTGLADFLAVHLVSQVLEEACIIVNNARDSGHPWRYISSLKKIRNYRWDEINNDELTFVVSKDDSQYENQENMVVTSTPQKIENNIAKSRNEVSFMGQGDEELEVRGPYELRKSTSMFINHLFDMSDVEHVIITDGPNMIENRNTRSEELLTETNKNNLEGKQQSIQLQANAYEVKSEENYSSYSFLSDALFTDNPKDFDFFKCDNDKTKENKLLDDVQNSTIKELTRNLNETIEKMDNNDLEMYENAFLTMNRDYDQNSEEDEPVLQDPKVASLEEVDLITISNSNDNVIKHETAKELNAVSGVSNTGTSSRKSNIMRRCRNQGVKLLSCLRGWLWRKKLFGKRKEPRGCGSIRGLYPLSPDARRRAASLLDHRNLSTPSPPRSVVWKFNTVNEALVHSSHWKDFEFKMNLNENDEF
ncbi:uncharacterized protein LOC126772912 isoform X2 [Nymphalis io]|uniref:uncharacterized protein LOC126772912 isoform X2 n=1 Tax=Inachis io TaxID=171585 RepID=UPI0021674804|nr:uncharacterized protein LOC126772912 isoform X2 [Nymphalis io]